MAATKTGSSVISGATSSAGSTYGSPSTGCQSASQNLTTYYGTSWTVRMVPDSGVTTGCTAQIDVSYDGTTWRAYKQVTSSTVDGEDDDSVIILDASIMYSRVTFFGNAGGSVVCSAELESLTGI